MASEIVAPSYVDTADRAGAIIHHLSGVAAMMRSAAYSNDHPDDESWGACAALMDDMLSELGGRVRELSEMAKQTVRAA